MLNYVVKNYKWGPSWWRKDRKGNKTCLQGLKLKSLLMKVKGESEKAGIKLNIQKMKIIASGPITSWQINEETVETVTHTLSSWAPKLLQMVKLKDACSSQGNL